MYIVIFKAIYNNIDQLDEEYFSTEKTLRARAKEQYHCQGFTSATEGNQEIALSYWLSLDDIHSWKNDPIHKLAQAKGASEWYESYSVEIAKIL